MPRVSRPSVPSSGPAKPKANTRRPKAAPPSKKCAATTLEGGVEYVAKAASPEDPAGLSQPPAAMTPSPSQPMACEETKENSPLPLHEVALQSWASTGSPGRAGFKEKFNERDA